MNLRRRGCRTLAIAFTGLLLAAGCTPAAEDAEGGKDLLAGGAAQPDLLGAAPAEEAGKATSALRAACTMPVTGLVINEFMADPSGVPANTISDNNGEWVEFYNPTAAPIDMQGMHLRAPDGNSHTIASSVVVPSLGYAVLCRNASVAVNGGVTCNYQYSNFFLTNTGDTIELCSDASCNTIVDQVVFTGQAPTGFSIELRHPYLDNAAVTTPASPNVAANWDTLNFGLSTGTLTSGDKGTPGARNSLFQQVEDPTCNDNNVCTWDVCQAGNCAALTKPGCCLTNNDCADQLPCTEDLCDAGTHTCTNTPKPNCCTKSEDCLDANPCNQDYCSMGTCAHSAYNIVPGCCYSATGDQVAADSQCDDKNPCTQDHCNQNTNLCYQDPPRANCCSVNENCDDNDPCTYDQCWNNTCANPPVSANCCTDNGDCDDNNPCTDDQCAFSSCRHFWKAAECCYDNAWCAKNADDGNPCTDERCVLNAGTGRSECQHPYKSNCAVDLPYVQPFDGEVSLADVGWKVVDYGTNAKNHWLLDTTNGDLGPDAHVLFTWTPTTQLVKSFVVTPSLNAVKSQQDGYNYYGVTTLQFRMLYKHSQPGAYVGLKVVATATSDFLNGTVLKSWRTNEDLEYTIYSVELPNALKFSPTLKIGFMVDTEDGTTFNMDSLEIDDVKIASGKGNTLVKSKVYRCPGGSLPCNVNTGTLVGASLAPDPVPTMTMGVQDWYRVYLCMYDPDARYFTWQYFGFPGAFVDGSPMDNPTFVQAAPDVGQGGHGCETAGFAVASLCGVPTSIPGYFYCAVDVKPQGNEDAAGAYRSALVVKDEFDPALPLHHPYESQTKFNVNLLLNDGYLVWSPNGRDDPAAMLLQAHIKSNGRKAQIVSDLDMVPDLSVWDGVVAVLGVYGNSHPISNSEASRLKVYLEGGGKMYLEGGEYFWGQKTDTVLLPYFKTTATSDGVAKQDGPLAGTNFLYGYDFDYGQGATVNAWNDRLIHTPTLGGREILRNAGAKTYASMVAYEGLSAAGNVYRTVGSSVLYQGLAAKAGGKPVDEALGRILDFLENGYPACTQVEQCEDYEVCTDDACSSAQCVNAARPGCIPCEDDAVRPDGSAACPIDQACLVSAGYCTDIPAEDRFDIAAGTCGKFFGSGPTSAFCTLDVTKPASIDDIQVKVEANHLYRGQVKLTLRSPSGDSVVLKDGNPADAKRNTYFTYDVGVPSAESMDAFNSTPTQNKHLEGTWTLVAEDLDPAIYNGLLEGFHLYATHSPLPCIDVATDCPDDPCATVSCIDSDGNGTKECVYVEMDCDDGKDCTIDYCDPAAHACVNEPITGSGCACANHDECPKHEACLNQAETATCDPVGDKDPVSGEMHCQCSPVAGTPFEATTGLPAAIPDNDATGVTVTIPVTAANYVNAVKVRVKTNHPAVGDLQAELCHLGTCVMLRNLRGGAVAGFHDVYDFDVVDGPGALVDFRKLPLAGDWDLTVSDNIASSSGSVTGVIVYVMPADCFANSDCDDSNPCTADACQNPSTGGTCEHVTKTCAPSTDPCVADQCNPATGNCEPANQPDGTPCEDGLYCTMDDSCSAGTCTSGGARDCTYLDGTCIVGTCNEDLKQCVPNEAPNGAACDDGEVCTGGDSCLDGGCQPGTQLLCACPTGNNADCIDDGNLCNGHLWICNAQRLCELTDGPVVCPDLGLQCVNNVCDPFDGRCKNQMELNFMPCEDGAYCSVADYCETGACKAGIARDCSGLDEDCKTGVCNETANACEAQNKTNGTTCEKDGAGCTIDQCTNGNCVFKQNVDCSAIRDDCNDGVCQNVGWGNHLCVKGPLADGTVCTDEPNPCTSDTCLSGLCEHTVLQNCSGPCGGSHPFDAGDNVCGFEDSCQGGIQGFDPATGIGKGACVPTCIAPNCIREASDLLDMPIDERLGCTVAALDVATAYTFVDSIEAKVRLSHSYLGDLTIDVIDPQGYNHRVWNHIGGANADFANTFDLSFPVPYPGIPTSGVPMCSLAGEQANGTWYLKVCDTGNGNGGVLHDWKLYVRGSMDPNLNQGHRCSDAIDLGSHPVVPTINVDGTTQCALNSVSDTGCGGNLGPDRLYKFTLTAPRRVTIKLFQPDRDLIMFVKGASGGSCAAGALECAQLYGAGATPETLDRQMVPGTYYLGIDTAGGPYDYGSFRFEIRIKDLLPDGADCVGDLGPQDLDCMSQHCQNGFCCQAGDCCPGNAWAVPPDGTNPLPIKTTADWLSADAVCPAGYKEPTTCNPTVEGINTCQGQRIDANCVDHMCVKSWVDDDSACDESVQADGCGLWVSVFCGDEGPYVPGAQVKPTCPTTCSGDPDCDPEAHCDPAVATAPDQTVAPFTMTCVLDRVNGSTCNENTDCQSNHCQNGFCCGSGDCCPTADVPGALACPAAWTIPPVCDDTGACEGHRYDPVCSNNECGKVLVRDDCACSGLLSDNCGFFIPVYCGLAPSGTCPATSVGGGEFIAGDPACLDNCLTGGVEDDTKCDDVARCDLCTQARVDNEECRVADLNKAVCQGNMPNGYPCDEASDCANKLYLPPAGTDGGHCQNGFCCDYGDCCAQNTDCPIPTPPSGYWAPPICDDITTCQGHRRDATCISSVCGSNNIDDDSGCINDPMQPSDECGYYKPVYCNGQQVQTDPPCPTTCLDSLGAEDDSQCDDNAHCDPDLPLPNQINSICLPDLANDEFCNEASDCIGAFCQIHFCCDAGGCCAGCKVSAAELVNAMGGHNSVTGGDVRADGSQVQYVVGQPSPVENRLESSPLSRKADLGLLNGAVIPVQCYDGIRDVNETDVDCGGGICPACSVGKQCSDSTRDCATGLDCFVKSRTAATSSTCQTAMPATCKNGVKDAAETDVNCGGGTCNKCQTGKTCILDQDCLPTLDCFLKSGTTQSTFTCQAALPAACKDGAKNGFETDVDCGGGSCRQCYGTAVCRSNTDCESQVCTRALPTDALGTCAKQAAGTRCTAGVQCLSGTCTDPDGDTAKTCQ